MAYTEIKEKNGKDYFYRVQSIREGSKVKKKRIYLGVDLNKGVLVVREREADKELDSITTQVNSLHTDMN